MTNKIILGIVILAAVGAGVYFINMRGEDVVGNPSPMPPTTVPSKPGQVACTMEAKLCPDGSYVGRTGPNCEFTPCPTGSVTPQVRVSTTAKIGEKVSNNGVFITPLQVTQDARCPVSTPNCSTEGGVVLRARLERNGKIDEISFNTFTGTEASFEGKTVSLTNVSPTAGTVSATNAYVFTFLVN